MKNKLKVLLSFSLAVSMLLITACSAPAEPASEAASDAPATESQAPAEEPSGEAVSISFMRAGLEENKGDAFMQMIENFEAANPGYTVEYSEVDWGDIDTKWNTSFAAGTSADVVFDGVAKVVGRVTLGQYESLNSYSEGWEGLNDIYPAVLSAGTLSDNLYGIGFNADARVFAYNVEMFEAAGLDPDAPPTNWEELLAAHEALVIKEGDTVVQSGFALPTTGANGQQFLQIFALQNGVGGTGFVDADTHEILFNTEAGIEAMSTLQAMNEMGVIPWDFVAATSPFSNGTAAMAILGETEFVTAQETLGDAIKIAPMFGEEEPATFCGIHMYSMSTQTKDKDAAWMLIESLSSSDSSTIWSAATGSVTLRTSLESAYVESKPVYGQQILDAVANGYPASGVTYNSAMVAILDAAMQEIYYGVATVEDALNNAAAEVQAEIDNQ